MSSVFTRLWEIKFCFEVYRRLVNRMFSNNNICWLDVYSIFATRNLVCDVKTLLNRGSFGFLINASTFIEDDNSMMIIQTATSLPSRSVKKSLLF